MKIQSDPRAQQVMKWMTIIMAVAYMVLGTLLLLSFGDLQHMPKAQRLPMGIMLICYGLFRAYRFFRKYRHLKEDEDRT